mmetsp:Transcript_26371/g.59470  ORF Transcript_26371/g.59470 Transcript_26371/m.59470 type:complete len:248 (+) Transcript_26371:203-946(+)
MNVIFCALADIMVSTDTDVDTSIHLPTTAAIFRSPSSSAAPFGKSSARQTGSIQSIRPRASKAGSSSGAGNLSPGRLRAISATAGKAIRRPRSGDSLMTNAAKWSAAAAPWMVSLPRSALSCRSASGAWRPLPSSISSLSPPPPPGDDDVTDEERTTGSTSLARRLARTGASDSTTCGPRSFALVCRTLRLSCGSSPDRTICSSRGSMLVRDWPIVDTRDDTSVTSQRRRPSSSRVSARLTWVMSVQ